MSPFFDELESQIRAAAEGAAGTPNASRVGPSRRRRRWLPLRIDLAPVLASVAVVVLVVGAALVLLGRGGHQPSPPSSPPPNAGLATLIANTPPKQLRSEFSYIAAATNGVLASKECQVQQPTGSFVHRTPDRELLSVLGVLRRPATAADRLNHRVLAGVPDVYAGSIRRAFSANGESYYIAVVGFDRAASIPSDRCFVLQEQALARYLPKIPRALRAQTTALQAGYIAWGRDVFTHGPRDGICLVGIGRNETGTSCGMTATQIKTGMPPADDQGVFSGVVPDGVASVTLAFPAARGRSAQSVTGSVSGNVYAIRVQGEPLPPAEPAVLWRSAQGRLIKAIPVPTPAEQRAACRKELVTCTLLQYGGMSTSSTSSSGPLRAKPAPTR